METANRRRSAFPMGRVIVASRTIATIGALTTIFMVLSRYLRDGSMWLDEASIAYNLLLHSPLELFGPLETGHRFPRLYLVAISGLERLLGYQTLVLRALPVSAFVCGAAAWQRLLYLRFRSEPTLLLLGATLTLIPGSWFAYGAMLKPYSLDVLLALLPLLTSDALLRRSFLEGRPRTLLVALALPCLLSYTYVIALVGRLAAWFITTWRREGLLPPSAAAIGFPALVVALLACLWLTDLRHARAPGLTGGYWASCTPGQSVGADLAIVGSYLTGWARSAPVFGGGVGAPEAVVWLLVVSFALGAAEVVRRAIRTRVPDAMMGTASEASALADRAEWGSRSLACLFVVLCLWLGARLVGYPLCPGRVTLFSYFSLLVVTLEGGAAVIGWLARSHWKAHVARALIAAIAVAAMPAARATIETIVTREPPENIRPLLPLIEERPTLPIVIAACSTRQALTLPEWLGREDLYFGDDLLSPQPGGRPALPDAERFLVVSAGSQFYCPWFLTDLRRRAVSFRRLSDPHGTASLFEVTLPRPVEAEPGSQGPEPREPAGDAAGASAPPPPPRGAAYDPPSADST